MTRNASDALLDLASAQEQANAVVECMISEFFEEFCPGIITLPEGMPDVHTYTEKISGLVHLFPRMNTLIYLVSSLLHDAGKAIEILEKEPI